MAHNLSETRGHQPEGEQIVSHISRVSGQLTSLLPMTRNDPTTYNYLAMIILAELRRLEESAVHGNQLER
jgi:hypothetical protein